MRPRSSGRRTWRNSIQSSLVAGVLLVMASPGPGAAVSLDGSNCVLFYGQVKRELAVCVAWESEGRTLSISLVGRAPNNVEQIVLRRDGGEPFQTLHLGAQPPINASDVGVLYINMNFDGHGDLGIMRRGDLCVRQPFFFFLYNVHTKRFVRSGVLEALTGVSFDAKSLRVISRWRDEAFRYKDSYGWAGRSLQLRVRYRRGRAQGQCVRTVYERNRNVRTARDPKPCP